MVRRDVALGSSYSTPACGAGRHQRRTARHLVSYSIVKSSSLLYFLRATAATAVTRLSHCNSVCQSVRPSVTRVCQSKMVQARITKSSPSAAWKTLVSWSVKLFH